MALEWKEGGVLAAQKESIELLTVPDQTYRYRQQITTAPLHHVYIAYNA